MQAIPCDQFREVLSARFYGEVCKSCGWKKTEHPKIAPQAAGAPPPVPTIRRVELKDGVIGQHRIGNMEGSSFLQVDTQGQVVAGGTAQNQSDVWIIHRERGRLGLENVASKQFLTCLDDGKLGTGELQKPVHNSQWFEVYKDEHGFFSLRDYLGKWLQLNPDPKSLGLMRLSTEMFLFQPVLEDQNPMMESWWQEVTMFDMINAGFLAKSLMKPTEYLGEFSFQTGRDESMQVSVSSDNETLQLAKEAAIIKLHRNGESIGFQLSATGKWLWVDSSTGKLSFSKTEKQDFDLYISVYGRWSVRSKTGLWMGYDLNKGTLICDSYNKLEAQEFTINREGELPEEGKAFLRRQQEARLFSLQEGNFSKMEPTEYLGVFSIAQTMMLGVDSKAGNIVADKLFDEQAEDNEKWKLYRFEDGSYAFENMVTERWLTVDKGDGSLSLTPLERGAEEKTQRFSLFKNQAGQFGLRSLGNSRWMAIRPGSAMGCTNEFIALMTRITPLDLSKVSMAGLGWWHETVEKGLNNVSGMSRKLPEVLGEFGLYSPSQGTWITHNDATGAVELKRKWPEKTNEEVWRVYIVERSMLAFQCITNEKWLIVDAQGRLSADGSDKPNRGVFNCFMNYLGRFSVRAENRKWMTAQAGGKVECSAMNKASFEEFFLVKFDTPNTEAREWYNKVANFHLLQV